MPRDKAYLVILRTGLKPRNFLEESFGEIKELTLSAGGVIVGSSLSNLHSPSPSHFLREGKLQEVREKASQDKADLLIFNVDLTPVQARNIEAFCGIRPVDRTGLILDIFARRAKSREGRMQVELAQMNYLMPRLVGQGVLLSRLGGGIGTRGPGEQKLEVDRRKIRDRIQHIKKDLEKLRTHRELLRSGRKRKNLIQVTLVGYTNSGKSTLLNALTGSQAYAADQLFATLDPKTRMQNINGKNNTLFTDTVGFLKDLPHALVEAFHTTLEEVSEADCLIHVLDISNPRAAEQKKIVEEVLREIQADKKPRVLALNKADLLTNEECAKLQEIFSEGILISAKEKSGLNGLLAKLESHVPVEIPRRPE